MIFGYLYMVIGKNDSIENDIERLIYCLVLNFKGDKDERVQYQNKTI